MNIRMRSGGNAPKRAVQKSYRIVSNGSYSVWVSDAPASTGRCILLTSTAAPRSNETQTVDAKVPEEDLGDGGRFDWEGFYGLCVKHKIGYKGVPLHFRWRSFRARESPAVSIAYQPASLLPKG
jgi:hypothetical protein